MGVMELDLEFPTDNYDCVTQTGHFDFCKTSSSYSISFVICTNGLSPKSPWFSFKVK